MDTVDDSKTVLYLPILSAGQGSDTKNRKEQWRRGNLLCSHEEMSNQRGMLDLEEIKLI